MDTGVMATPPSLTADFLDAHGAHSAASLRRVFGGAPAPGRAATVTVGNLTAPILFVCGVSDAYLLCNRPYALRSAEYCTGGYHFLAVDCGHDVLSCENTTATEAVVAAVIANVKSV
jgi:pimeloyl-ACP methyl ester carboxylesterase